MPPSPTSIAAVQSTLASKRLGTPVFVLLPLRKPGQGDAVVPRLAQLSAPSASWLGQPLEPDLRPGAAASGHRRV